MALFNECMQSCAHIVLDTADIVRDGDFSPTTRTPRFMQVSRNQYWREKHFDCPAFSFAFVPCSGLLGT